MKEKKRGGAWISAAIKYGFSLGLLFFSLKTSGDFRYVIWGVLELLAIFLISNLLIARHKAFQIVQAILLLVFNAETLMVLFGGGYATLVMLQNLRSLEDLSGKAFIYGAGIVLILVASLFPSAAIRKKPLYIAAIAALPLWLIGMVISGFIIFGGNGGGAAYTPSSGVMDLCRQWQDNRKMKQLMATFAPEKKKEKKKKEPETSQTWEILPEETVEQSTEVQVSGTTQKGQDSYRHQVENNLILQEDLSDLDPEVAALTDYTGSIPVLQHVMADQGTNVILIFIEGMSKNIMTDPRNIMPRLTELEKNSISFTNYYDHTFATYRGLQGQLFSGHNYNDLDANHFLSLADVLRGKGYRSAFINTEPHNQDFTSYLWDLHFDNVMDAMSGSLFAPDKVSLKTLYDTAEEYHGQGKPFFLTMYTFGTHASLDAVDQLYGDGSDRVLNRFYNLDYYLGVFFDKFSISEMRDDTMIVITADHATYADEDYTGAFPKYSRVCPDVDTIPLLIYYRGNALCVDAGGRNSLDMAPTLLDILDTEWPETFLGNSLFYSKLDRKLDSYFWDPSYIVYTGNGTVENVGGDATQQIMLRLAHYFSVK